MSKAPIQTKSDAKKPHCRCHQWREKPRWQLLREREKHLQNVVIGFLLALWAIGCIAGLDWMANEVAPRIR